MTSNSKKIKILLIKNNLTQVELARRINAKPSYVHHVIHGIRKNGRMRSLIARELGCNVKQLFSDAA